MRTVAIINQKGGCGKTTTSINLAACLARLGHKTLLVDMDPQGHCGIGLAVPEDQIERTIYDAMIEEHDGKVAKLSEIVWQIASDFDLAPSTIKLAAFEQVFSGRGGREDRLFNALAPVQANYEWCIIDCAPSVGLLTFNALRACDEVIVPVETGFFSLHGLTKMMETLEVLRERCDKEITIRVLPTLYDTRTKLAREVLSELRAKFRDYLMESTVNFNTKLKEAASFGQPITEYDPGSRGYKDFVNLARELMGHRPAEIEAAPNDNRLSRPAELVQRAKQLAQLTNFQFGRNGFSGQPTATPTPVPTTIPSPVTIAPTPSTLPPSFPPPAPKTQPDAIPSRISLPPAEPIVAPTFSPKLDLTPEVAAEITSEITPEITAEITPDDAEIGATDAPIPTALPSFMPSPMRLPQRGTMRQPLPAQRIVAGRFVQQVPAAHRMVAIAAAAVRAATDVPQTIEEEIAVDEPIAVAPIMSIQTFAVPAAPAPVLTSHRVTELQRSSLELTTSVATLPSQSRAIFKTTEQKIEDFYGVKQIGDEVLFSARFERARKVQIAGDFNNWSPMSTPMMTNGQPGVFKMSLPLKPGRYRYRFVVDGAWMTDPNNQYVEANQFGELNNIVEVD